MNKIAVRKRIIRRAIECDKSLPKDYELADHSLEQFWVYFNTKKQNPLIPVFIRFKQDGVHVDKSILHLEDPKFFEKLARIFKKKCSKGAMPRLRKGYFARCLKEGRTPSSVIQYWCWKNGTVFDKK
jgi:hypothetical protein